MRDQTARAFVPGVRSFHHPALCLNHKTTGHGLGPQRLSSVLPGAGAAIARMANDFDGARGVRRFDGASTLSAIGTVRAKLAQPGRFRHRLSDDGRGGNAVLNAGRGHSEGQQ